MAAHQQTTPDRKRTGLDAWLDERIHSGKAIDFSLNHPVPLHIHPLDYLVLQRRILLIATTRRFCARC